MEHKQVAVRVEGEPRDFPVTKDIVSLLIMGYPGCYIPSHSLICEQKSRSGDYAI